MSRSRPLRVAVIGSGAGGAPAAARLARAWGEGVGIFEAGQHNRPNDFNQVERDMLPRLYAQAGAQATEDGSIAVLQGVGVGGSTVINDALCFAPPPELAERWRPWGVDLETDPLDAYVAEVEARLHVTEIPRSQINRANYLVGLGASRLGWAGERLRQNSPGCLQCGFRHLGCAYGVKQSMDQTFIPDALESGAQLWSKTPIEYLESVGGSWRLHTRAGAFDAEHVVLAAGVVQTPRLLLRSGIDAGGNVQFHLQNTVWGEFDEPVDAFNGVPMSYGVLEFADVYGHRGPGYLIEGVGVQPAAFSVQPQAEGAALAEILARYRHLAGALSLVRPVGRGRIRLGPDKRAKIEHPLVEADARRLADFYAHGAELMLAAGARRVLLTHRDSGWVSKVPDPGGFDMRPGRFYLYTAHPFGGAVRGDVLDGVGRVRGQHKLWVLDASGFPEAPGVNPQITIAALALQGAERILAGG